MSIAPLPPSTPAASHAAASGVQAKAANATAVSAAAGQAVPSPAAQALTAVALAKQEAAAQQGGLALLMANLARAAATGQLPPAVQSALDKLMELHVSTEAAPTAETVKQAFLRSGLFTEAMLTSNAPGMSGDLKTALLSLQQAVRSWPGTAAPAGNGAPPSTKGLPPPFPGSAGTAQPPAAASLPPGADPAEIASLLLQGADAALARHTLLQIGSLPDASGKASGSYWMFEIPLMTPQGSAVAQLAVERDGSGSSAESPEPIWRVQFAIDLEPLGPVRANLALSGGHVWVMLGADRPATLDKLRAGAGSLNDELQETLLAELCFQDGPAPESAPRPATFVDRAT